MKIAVAAAVPLMLFYAWGEAGKSSEVATRSAMGSFAAATRITLARVDVVGRCVPPAVKAKGSSRCAAA